MKHMPKINKFMTPMPHTIGYDIPIRVAQEMMRTHGFRHLPVQEGGKLVGVLTDRDIKLASSFARSDELRVEEVMSPEPYAVDPDLSLDEVVEQMAEHKYGCAVVEQGNGKVVGIFTDTDALRTLSEVLRENYRRD